jgi:hypothetical protein
MHEYKNKKICFKTNLRNREIRKETEGATETL